MRSLLGLAAIVLVAAQVSVATTFLLMPVWLWVEARSSIEAVGHSGPAEWCYLLVFTVLTTAAAVGYLLRRRRDLQRAAASRRSG